MRVFLLLAMMLALTGVVGADVIWGPVIYVFWAIRHWYVLLLVGAVIAVTIILIKRLKK